MGNQHELTWVMRLRERISGPMRAIASRTGTAYGRVRQLNVGLKRTDGILRKIKLAAVGVFAGFTIGHVITDITRLGSEMQNTRVAYSTFLGDAQQANSVIDDLVKFSSVTPYKEPEIIKSGRVLLAANVQAGNLVDTLRKVGDVAAGAQVPLADMVAIYAKGMNKGKIQAEELNQMAERGIPILQTFSKMFGVTTSQVMELGSQGKLTSDHMKEAFNVMTSEGGVFFNMMEELSKTLSGRWSTLVGNLEVLGIEIGESLIPALSEFVEVGIGMVGFLKEYHDILDVVIKLGAIFLAGWIALKTVMIATAFVQRNNLILMTAWKMLTMSTTGKIWLQYIAQQALNAALGNWVALAAGVAAAAAVTYMVMADGSEEAATAQATLTKSIERTTSSIEKQNQAMERSMELRKELNQLNAKERVKVLDEFHAIRARFENQDIMNQRQVDGLDSDIKKQVSKLEDALADVRVYKAETEANLAVRRKMYPDVYFPSSELQAAAYSKEKFGVSQEEMERLIDILQGMDKKVVSSKDKKDTEKKEKDALNELRASEGKIQHITQNLEVNQDFSLDHESLEQRFEEIKQSTLRVVANAARDAIIIAGKTG